MESRYAVCPHCGFEWEPDVADIDLNEAGGDLWVWLTCPVDGCEWEFRVRTRVEVYYAPWQGGKDSG